MRSEQFEKACLYDVRWQVMRVSMLAANSKTDGWATLQGVKVNLKLLETYLKDDFHRTDNLETALRCHRIKNLLSAVMLGYGNKEDFKGHRASVQEHFNQVSKLYEGNMGALKQLKSYVTNPNNVWDWSKVEADLIRLNEDDPDTFDKLFKDLVKRTKTSIRKNGHVEYRPELIHFMKLMAMVGSGEKTH